MLPWPTLILLDRDAERAVYLQIAEAIVREISRGRLPPGLRLPGSRQMATALDVNRKTVTLAYEELMAQGWVDIRPSSGVFIAEQLPLRSARPLGQLTGNPAAANVSPPPSVYDLVELFPPLPPHHLQAGSGEPDVRLAPLRDILRHYRYLTTSHTGQRLLRYGAVAGENRARQIVADYLQATRGLANQAERVMLTRGSQMAIYLFCHSLLRPGDYVVVGEPGYDATDWTVQTTGAELLKLAVDDHGLIVEELAELCDKHPIKAIYLTPHHHYPTTVTLSAQRRLHLLQLAERYGFYILEDDYDYDFHYERAPYLPLASLDRVGRVVYVGAFSKLLAPALRLGYLWGPKELLTKFARLRRIIDRQGDTLLEYAVTQMIIDGDIQRHLKKVIPIYRERRDHCCRLLRENLEGLVDFTVPDGGMAIWLTVRRPLDYDEFMEACLARGVFLDINRNILEKHQGFRLGFAATTTEEMTEVVGVLREVCKSAQTARG